MNTTSPTALRAAERIQKKLDRVNPEWCMSFEQIIDTEFASERAELIEALKGILDESRYDNDQEEALWANARATLAKYSQNQTV